MLISQTSNFALIFFLVLFKEKENMTLINNIKGFLASKN